MSFVDPSCSSALDNDQARLFKFEVVHASMKDEEYNVKEVCNTSRN